MTFSPTNASGSYFVLLCGLALLIYATYKAYAYKEDYPKLIAFGLLADMGFMGMALASWQGIGILGAFVFIAFQILARALALAAHNNLYKLGLSCQSSHSSNAFPLLPKHSTLIQGALQNPVVAALFALGMFASVGGSPFLVPEGRFFATQGIVAANSLGGILPLLLVACSNLIFIYLHLNIVRKIYFEHTSNAHSASSGRSVFSGLSLVSMCLTFAVIIFGLLRTPITDIFASYCSVELIHTSAHMAFVVLFVGSFVLAIVGYKFHNLLDKLSIAIMALAFICAMTLGDLSPMARLFAVLISGVGLLVCIYSSGYMAHGHRLLSYYFFLLLTFAALLGIVTSSNLGVFYGYWELMTFASYFLVIHERVGEGARTVLDAGSKYYLMCAGGALVMLPGFALLAGHTADFADMIPANLSPFTLKIALMLSLTGFAAKAGLVPLQAWLPDAHPAAPSSVSGPLSGIITKLGIFGIVALLLGEVGSETLKMPGFGSLFQDNDWPMSLSWFGYNLSFLGAITLIYGEIMALRQDDIKRMLAYSTLGQLGEIVLVLGLGTYLATVAALTHVINHAIMKDLLFLGAGTLILRTGSRKLEDLRGLGAHMPLTVGFMSVGLLSIMGLPPFVGFTGKYLMIQASINAGHWLMAALIIAGSLVGAVYYTRILRTLIFEKRPAHLLLTDNNVREENRMIFALGVLALFCVILGVFPSLSQTMITAAAGQYFTSTAGDVAILASMNVQWPIYVVVPMLGALMPFIYRHDRALAGRATVAILLLTSVLVLIFGRNLDTLSFSFALIVPLIGALNMVYAIDYMEHSHTQWRFYSFFCAMCAGLLGLASATYLFSFFLFWEIMSSWALYFTIAHEGTKESLNEAFKYFIFNLAGAGFIFLGVCMLGANAPLNALNLKDTWLNYGALPEFAGYAAYALLALGFVMKAAQLPFRIDWQMHPALAPTPVSGFISSVLLKSAVFGLMKLFVIIGGGLTLLHALTPAHAHTVQVLVMWVGGITIVMAAVQALLSSNLKLIFIYSTVSQIGYMVLAVGVGTGLGFAGGLLHVINHVFFKDLLFLMCGVIMFQSHKDNLQDLGGIAHKMPFTLSMFAIAGLSVVGIPPTSGFTSKWIIYHALMQQGQPFLALLSLVGSVITLAYIAKFLHTAFMGQQSNQNHTEHIQDASRRMRIPMLILAAGCVVLGIFPGLMLYPINGILGEYGLQTLHVGLTGLQSGPAAWNATNMFVMMALATFITRKALMYFVNKNHRITPIHSCGLSPNEATSRMQPNSVYGGLMTFWRESIFNLHKK